MNIRKKYLVSHNKSNQYINKLIRKGEFGPAIYDKSTVKKATENKYYIVLNNRHVFSKYYNMAKMMDLKYFEPGYVPNIGAVGKFICSAIDPLWNYPKLQDGVDIMHAFHINNRDVIFGMSGFEVITYKDYNLNKNNEVKDDPK